MNSYSKLFHSNVLALSDENCPAVQKAIDSLGVVNGQDRSRLFAWLEKATDSEVCDAIMVAWARCDLKAATGKSRDEWWSLITGLEA